jgi:Zn-dependent protease
MNPDTIYAALTWIIPLVIAVTFHEVAHGMVANWFGDGTAKDAGRLTFNPIRHIDPIGTVLLPMILAVTGAPIFGWAKPVPVRPGNLRNPRWHGLLVTAAGPAMNFALAVIAAAALSITLRLSGDGERDTAQLFLLINLNNFLMVNLFLGVFNLIPIPPLDGGRILTKLLPTAIGRRFAQIGRFGFILLVMLLVVFPMISPAANFAGILIDPPVRAMAHGLFTLFMGR